MTKTPRHHLASSDTLGSAVIESGTLERIGLPTFSAKLYQFRTAAGMSMSDLARKIWGTTVDARGYETAKNKDRISRWEKGDQLPEPQNLALLAKALGVTIEELAPDLTAQSVDRQPPAISMTMVAGHPDKVHLVINTLCSLAVAAKIIAQLSEDPVANKGP